MGLDGTYMQVAADPPPGRTIGYSLERLAVSALLIAGCGSARTSVLDYDQHEGTRELRVDKRALDEDAWLAFHLLVPPTERGLYIQ